jgi:hypothetical protein
MNALRKSMVTITALGAVALGCIGCAASATNIDIVQTPAATHAAAPTATGAPTRSLTPTIAPSPTPLVLSSGDFSALESGRRYALPSRGTNPRISFVAPSGWVGNETMATKDYGNAGPDGPVWFPQPFDHGFKNPCTDHTPVLPAAGSGPDGLLKVIAGQPGIKAGPITDVTVGGHAGKSISYTVTVDPATCPTGGDDGGFWIWGTCSAPVTVGCEMVGFGDRRYGVALDSPERAFAIDLDGRTVTFFTKEPVHLSATDRAELQQVIDSMEFEPGA